MRNNFPAQLHGLGSIYFYFVKFLQSSAFILLHNSCIVLVISTYALCYSPQLVHCVTHLNSCIVLLTSTRALCYSSQLAHRVLNQNQYTKYLI